jgi:hypothetical protein
MAALVLICTKEEQRTMVHFLWMEGVKGIEIDRHLSAPYGDNVLSHWNGLNGQTSVMRSAQDACSQELVMTERNRAEP